MKRNLPRDRAFCNGVAIFLALSTLISKGIHKMIQFLRCATDHRLPVEWGLTMGTVTAMALIVISLMEQGGFIRG